MKKVLLVFLIMWCAVTFAQPFQNRILIATSTDGLNWQRRNIIFSDSGDVPDAVIGPNGQVYAYFQGQWTPTIDGIMVGISDNGISGWSFSRVQISGTSGWRGKPCDPDIIVFGNNFRLYFTGDPIGDMKPETYSAISSDGINFTLESGVRFEILGSPVLDPSLLLANDTLQYFAGGAPPGENWHAHSADGLQFFRKPNFSAENLLMANGIKLTNGYRFYSFVGNQPQHGIRSLYSIDGENWSVEPGYRLQLDSSNALESRYVKEPAVVFKDSIYIMYYVTRKPLSGIDEEKNLELKDQFPIKLFQNSPNPFRKETSIRFQIQSSNLKSGVSIKIYDITGKLVSELPITNLQSPITEFEFNGKDSNGKDLPNGIYFYSLKTENLTQTKKLILLK